MEKQLQDVNSKLDFIITKLSEIQGNVQILEESTTNMDNHVDMVNGVFNSVLPCISTICKGVYYLTGDVSSYEQIKFLENGTTPKKNLIKIQNQSSTTTKLSYHESLFFFIKSNISTIIIVLMIIFLKFY